MHARSHSHATPSSLRVGHPRGEQGVSRHGPPLCNGLPFAGSSPNTAHTKMSNVAAVAACLRPGLRGQGANRDTLFPISTLEGMPHDPWITL
eukprot:1485739-Pyramimonas_sp.AAC.1